MGREDKLGCLDVRPACSFKKAQLGQVNRKTGHFQMKFFFFFAELNTLELKGTFKVTGSKHPPWHVVSHTAAKGWVFRLFVTGLK